MVKPLHYVHAGSSFFLDIREIAIASVTPDGQLLVYLKNSGVPVVLMADSTQSQAIISSIIGYKHHVEGSKKDE